MRLELDPGVNQRISRGMVALFKQHLGRGPTMARTFVNDDVITVILHDTLTAVERTLTETEHAAVVRDMRRSFQSALCDEITALVERETGCNIKAFMSDHTVLPDYAVECFVLERPSESEEDPNACADRKEQDREGQPGVALA